MASDQKWITNATADLKSQFSRLPEGVFDVIQQRVKSTLSERQLTPAQQRDFAGALVRELLPKPEEREKQCESS